jgi:hypothetical protein
MIIQFERFIAESPVEAGGLEVVSSHSLIADDSIRERRGFFFGGQSVEVFLDEVLPIS